MFEKVAILYVSNNSFREKKVSKVCTFLMDELSLLNFQVEKINFVNENEQWVAYDLIFLSRQFDIVIVIGDLGTSVISNAFGKICCEELVVNPKLPVISNGCSESYDMKLLPSVVKFLVNSCSYPILYLQRIFIIKENYVEGSFSQLLRNHLQQYRLKPKFSKNFIVHMESSELDCLKKVKHTKMISVTKNETFTTLTLEDSNFENFVECETSLKTQLGDKIRGTCDNNNMLEVVYRSKEENIQQAINSIEKCFNTYGIENVFLSFNGGKDCTVLLHLVYLVLKMKYPEFKQPIFCLYVRSHDVFPEQDSFIAACQVYYNLEVLRSSLSIKEALEDVLRRKPNLKACFMGTRRTDPYSSDLNVFQMTDTSWPQVMRVSPILQWRFTDIWDYLLFYKVPYCKLYDLGYTSLGNASNTIKNPSLACYDVKSGKNIYLPAYKMLNEAEERTGRNVLK